MYDVPPKDSNLLCAAFDLAKRHILEIKAEKAELPDGTIWRVGVTVYQAVRSGPFIPWGFNGILLLLF
jgi:hypothetical protein